jgi:hypothetical protein
MNNVSKILAAAALIASTSSLAFAQVGLDVGAGASGEVGVEAGDSVTVDASGNANANANANADDAGGGDVNYGSIASSLNTSSVAAADIEALGADAQIEVITLSEIRGNAAENASAIEQAVAAQAAGLEDLRVAIRANADVQAALDAEGVTADQIVAVTSSGEGNLTIVVDDAL